MSSEMIYAIWSIIRETQNLNQLQHFLKREFEMVVFYLLLQNHHLQNLQI